MEQQVKRPLEHGQFDAVFIAGFGHAARSCVSLQINEANQSIQASG